MDWMLLLERGFWFGAAALGFAVLFRVPERSLVLIFIIAILAGITRDITTHFRFGIATATFISAIIIGLVSIPAAHNKHAPPLVFAIPAVIPMVPGIFAYRTMIGLIKLAGNLPPNSSMQILSDTINNGLKVMFVLMSLASGVAIPMLLTRKESVKYIRIKL